MAGRIRTIKPEILDDEKTAALSHLEWRLFVSLWLLADDFGNLRGDPTYVLGQTLWAAGETPSAVAAALLQLAGAGLLLRYVVRGQTYYHVNGWDKHQKVSKPGKPRMPGPRDSDMSEAASEYPNSGDSPGIPEKSQETPRPDHRSPITDHRSSSEVARAIGGVAPEHVPDVVPAVAPPAAPPAANHPPLAVPCAPPPAPPRPYMAAERPMSKPDPGAVARAAAPAAYDPQDPFARGRLAEATYRRVSDARIALAREFKLPDQLPFPAMTPSSRPRGYTELLDRVREEAAAAPAACDRVVANLIAQAREARDVEWVAEKAFGSGAWATARAWISKRPPKRSGSGAAAGGVPIADPVRAPMTETDRAELAQLADRLAANPAAAAAAELACGRVPKHMATEALVRMFGSGGGERAPPAAVSTDESTDRDHDDTNHEETA